MTTSGPPPPFSSPMMVAPPTKKIRADDDGEMAKAARRKELERLRQENQQRKGFMAKTGAKLAGPPAGPPGVQPTARPSAHSASAASTASRPGYPLGATGAPPAGHPIGRARSSDIFPTVKDKVSASAVATTPVVRKLDFAQGKAPAAAAQKPTGPPPVAAAPVSAPMPPPDKLRSKSAPPSRPPPPASAPPPLVKEAPDTAQRTYHARPPPTNVMAPQPTTKTPSKANPSAHAPAPYPAAAKTTTTGSAPPKGAPAPAPAPFPVAVAMTDDSSSHASPRGWRAVIEQTSPLPGKPTLAGPKAAPGLSSMPLPFFNAAPAARAPPDGSGPSPTESANMEGPPPSKQPPMTPAVNTDGPPTSSSRKAMIDNMRNAADTPHKAATTSKTPAFASKDAPPMFSPTAAAATPAVVNDDSNLLQMEKALREAEQSKADALRQITRLEEQVQNMKERSATASSSELDQLVARAERDGDAAALQWAKAKVTGSATPAGLKTPKAPQVGFFPMSPIPGMATPRSHGHTRKRVSTPHPKREAQEDDQARPLFVDACRVAFHRFESPLATFHIRRPFGLETDRELWLDAGFLSGKQYALQAKISTPTSFEVFAEINADGSMLMIYGENTVRLRASDIEADWQEVGSIEETSRPLGHVAYIDRDANEKEYSLDEVFEEAMLCRETYCALVVGMAAGIREKSVRHQRDGPQEIPGVQLSASNDLNKAASSDACVGTEDLPFTPPPAAVAPPAAENPGGEKKSHQERKAPPPPPEDEGGPDVLASFGATLMFWVYSCVWFFSFQLPRRIAYFTLCLIIAVVIAIWIQIQLQDLSAAERMKATMDFHYNQPGIM